MAAGRVVLSQYFPARDRSGRLVAGARLFIYENGTTTKAGIFADEALTTPLANPVVANASGQFPSIWASDAATYSLSITGAKGESIGNPSVFDDYSVSTDAENAAVALAESASLAAAAYYEDILATAGEYPDSAALATRAAKSANLADLSDPASARENIGADLAENLKVEAPFTATIVRTASDKFADLVSLRDWDNDAGKGNDDAPAIILAAADLATAPRGEKLYLPSATFELGEGLGNLPHKVQIEGASRNSARILRAFNGGVLLSMLDGSGLRDVVVDGNGGAFTGGLVEIPIGNGNQDIQNVRLINVAGGIPLRIRCTGNTDETVGGSRLDIRNLEAWRSDSTPGSGRYAIVHDDPGFPAAGHPISIHHLETSGYEALDLGAANDVYFTSSTPGAMKWSEHTRGFRASTSRFTAPPEVANYEVKGTAGFANCSFARPVVVGANANVKFDAACEFNHGFTDNSGTNGLCSYFDDDPVEYTPSLKAGGVAVTIGTGVGTGYTGRWTRAGKMVTVTIRILLGAGPTVPSGPLTVTLPTNTYRDIRQWCVEGRVQPTNGTVYPVTGFIDAEANEATLEVLASGAISPMSSTTPSALGDGTGFYLTFTYEV